MSTDDILIFIIELFTEYLDELNETPRNDFIHGEMTAYVETLEILQKWERAKEFNLNYVIANKYKI